MIEWSKYIYILDVLGIPIHVILSGNNYLLEIVFEIKLIVIFVLAYITRICNNTS